MKQVYVVRGSEDGTLGVYSSLKNALSRALVYLNQNGPATTFVTFVKFEDGEHTSIQASATLPHIKTKLEKSGFAEIEMDGERTTASIEAFVLNQN